MITDQQIFLGTATVLILLGISSMVYSRNLVKTVMSFQIVVFGANLALFSSGLAASGNLISNSLVLFSIVVGASVEAVGLGVVVTVHRKYGTLNPMEIKRLSH